VVLAVGSLRTAKRSQYININNIKEGLNNGKINGLY
jgi:hypothetical protein